MELIVMLPDLYQLYRHCFLLFLLSFSQIILLLMQTLNAPGGRFVHWLTWVSKLYGVIRETFDLVA